MRNIIFSSCWIIKSFIYVFVLFQTLLMSHSNTPASASAGPPPPSSVASVAAAASHPSATALGAYPVVPPPPSLMAPHVPLAGHHPHLSASHQLYHPAAQFTDMLWKSQRTHAAYGMPTHMLAAAQQSGAHSGASTEELLAVREQVMQDRERQERMYRERQNQELEKQKEKERMERDKQEREKMERERERQEREKEEKERQEQALHNHFEKSLRAAQPKVRPYLKYIHD